MAKKVKKARSGGEIGNARKAKRGGDVVGNSLMAAKKAKKKK